MHSWFLKCLSTRLTHTLLHHLRNEHLVIWSIQASAHHLLAPPLPPNKAIHLMAWGCLLSSDEAREQRSHKYSFPSVSKHQLSGCFGVIFYETASAFHLLTSTLFQPLKIKYGLLAQVEGQKSRSKDLRLKTRVADTWKGPMFIISWPICGWPHFWSSTNCLTWWKMLTNIEIPFEYIFSVNKTDC